MTYTDLNNLEDLQFIPVGLDKRPTVKDWQKTRKRYDLGACQAVGLVCGALSGGLEAIDIDSKYDLTEKLFDNYKNLIHQADPTLLKKLVVQKTKGKGYHLIYRCEIVEGNQKLANRPTTAEERKKTYDETYAAELKKYKGADNAKELAQKAATKAAQADKVRVLIETRGEGGQIVCYPTEGYTLLHGDFSKIQVITVEQREILHSLARQFNQLVEEYQPKVRETRKQKGLSPFEDFNERGDVVALLEQHGWRVVTHRRKAGKTFLLRPGQTTSASSGDYDHDKRWFSVFTTSSEFEPQKAYLPYAVFAILECGGNFSDASKKLYDMGYGDRIEQQKEINQKTPSKISLVDNDYSFVVPDAECDRYLDMVRTGTLPMGMTTGMPWLDRHFLFKDGAFVIVNGFDNVGKTTVILFLALIAALYHDWSWILYCAENSSGELTRKLMEFYWNKSVKDMSEAEYSEAREFVRTHFTFIKNEELYNYKDLLVIAEKLLKRKKYKAMLWDPYNALKIELTNSSKLSTHEYHYEAVSETKQFCLNHGLSIWINTHAVTSASRLRSEDNKRTPAPRKGDVEGGAKFANKADEFLTIHRHTDDPENWMVTELHVRKIKVTETGGRVTPRNMPVLLRMMKGGFAFCENPDIEGALEESPIERYHKNKRLKPIQLYETPLFNDEKEYF